MLTSEQRQRFDEDGYVVVPGVLDTDQVSCLREFLQRRFDLPEDQRYDGDVDGFLFDIYNRYPELRWLLFHEPSIAVLRDLLGPDFVVLRECAAQREQFGHWHKDTTSQERAGHQFHDDDEFLMVEAAYYLQDNDPWGGGGLDVEPGSHRRRDPFARRTFAQRAWGKITGGPKAASHDVVTVPSRAGDLVVFHFRLNHKATPRRRASPGAAPEKLAVFQACSANTKHVAAYHDFITHRPSYVYLRDFVYSPEVLAEAREHDVTLA
jgi:hypothetical protein